jgi:hypothetical protein
VGALEEALFSGRVEEDSRAGAAVHVAGLDADRLRADGEGAGQLRVISGCPLALEARMAYLVTRELPTPVVGVTSPAVRGSALGVSALFSISAWRPLSVCSSNNDRSEVLLFFPI